MSRGGDASRSSVTSVVALYAGLAYAITWLGVSPLVAQALGRYGGPVPEWWHAVGALGPILAAAVAARITGRKEAVQAWITALSRYRIGARWWAVAVGSPLALWAIAVTAARVVTGGWSSGEVAGGPLTRPSWWLGITAVSVAYGLGEEPGWRGFLLPQLMRRRSARSSTLLIAVIWSAWHIPFFTYRYDFAGPATVVGFFAAMLAGAAWLSFLYLATGGSVPAVATWHVMWDVVNFAAAQLSDLVVGILNAAIIVVGFGILLMTGPGLRWTRRERT